MTKLNETHDPALRSWVASANAADTDFPVQNLPFAVFRRQGSAEDVRMAWGGDFEEPMPHEPGGCHYLIPKQPVKQGYKVAFMIEGERFVRIDVASDQVAAPGGGRIGMSADELQQLYKGALQSMPHNYVEGGRYLSVGASGVAPSKLVFEVDESGKVSRWRVGLIPQADYVEGCS